MTTSTRRTLRWTIGVVGLTALVSLAIVAFLGWRLSAWHEWGWVGLTFGDPATAELAETMGPLLPDSGRVFHVQPDSPASRAGLQVGDRIVSILGLPLEEMDEIRARSDLLGRGDEVVFVLESSGETREVVLILESPLNSVPLLVTLATSLLVAFVFLVTGCLVAWAQPFARQARIFFLTTSASALVFGGTALANLEFYSRRGLEPFAADESFGFFFLFYLALSSVFSSLLLHLALVFPGERPILQRGSQHALLTWVHGGVWLPLGGILALVLAVAADRKLGWAAPWISLGLAGVALIAFLVPARREVAHRGVRAGLAAALAGHPLLTWWVTVSGAVSGLSLLLTFARPSSEDLAGLGAAVGVGSIMLWLMVGVLYAGLTCWCLWLSYRESDLEGRRQLRWPLWGVLLSLGGSTLVAVVGLAHTFFLPTSEDIALQLALSEFTKLLFLALPLGFAFGILKYRLLEVDLILKKTLVYSAATGVVVMGYFLLVGTLGLGLVSYFGVQSQAVTILATLAVAALFVPIRRRIQLWVDRRFASRRASAGEVLRRLGEHALEADHPDDLLRRAVEELQPALQVRSVVALGREKEEEPFSVRATVGIDEERVRDLRLDDDDPLVGAGEAVLRVDPDTPAPWRDHEERLLAAAAARHRVRVSRRGTVEAILLLGKSLEDGDEVQNPALLTAVADQLAVGLGSLRRRQQDTEVQQAFQIQRALLPGRLEQLPGFQLAARWLPARQVSGDYYDVLPLDATRRGLCIGDVSGKGLPAALLMSSLQAAVKAMATASLAPDRVVAAVRRVVSQNLTGGQFITFFYAVLNTDGALDYASAGHNPPLLVRADGSIEALETTGGAIARLFLDTPLPLGRAHLRPGDRLVCFTDGVVEARNRRSEELGDARLEALLRRHRGESAEELAESITREARAFTGGELQDDLSLLVVAAAGR